MITDRNSVIKIELYSCSGKEYINAATEKSEKDLASALWASWNTETSLRRNGGWPGVQPFR